jgi:hypothetical protein
MKRALFDGALNDRVLSITSGTDESSQCFTFLARIAEDRGNAIGEKARQAIQRAHAPHAVALQLGELWNRFAPIIRKKSEQQRGLYAKAEAALEAEMKRLIDSEPPIAGDIFNTIVSTTLAEIQRFRSA